MLKYFTFALTFLCLATGSEAQNISAMRVMSLNGTWQFHQDGQEYWMPATVPGTVHTDLLANGKIEDPYYRVNEREVQWVDKVDWEYTLEFEVAPEMLEYDAAQLEFLGLDTYAAVYLNDSLIIEADNFFVSWEREVKALLKPGKNQLRVFFRSPTAVGLKKLAEHGFPLPAVNDQSENGGLGDHRVSVFLRKPGYHFGWDWGPRLVSIGIWRPVQLRFWNSARLEDVFFRQDSLNQEKARMTAVCEARILQSGNYTLEIWSGDSIIAMQALPLEAGRHTINVLFGIENPVFWWTKELGEPFLYPLEARLLSGGEVLDKVGHRVGLRTIRVVQAPDADGKGGSSFYFELNGRPVFAKGANYIPNDLFIPRVGQEHYRRMIASTVEANMNMLRVWGGGFYEEDIFYDLCDENGILVWQDFMFACSMYPGDAGFLERVEAEAVYNVRRLRNRPCIALWCGNNEIDVAWANFSEFRGWGWKQKYNKAQRQYIWEAYENVFHEMLPAVVGTHHPGMFYWPSSPYYKPGEHAGNNTPAGDIHYWGVWQSDTPFTAFYEHIGRFMSEYGFQSFPEMKTIMSYALPEDLEINSEVMSAHQRSFVGNDRMTRGLRHYYHVPEKFPHFVYLAQLLQAEGIKMAIEAHRSAMPYNMGSLYWQLNDCWPVASWSGMDYFQRWKAMHYFIKKAFEPVILVAQEKNGFLQLHVVSDLKDSLSASLDLQVLDFKGNVLENRSYQVQMPENCAFAAANIPLTELRGGANGKERVLELILKRGEETLARSLHYFQPVKSLSLPKDPGLRTNVGLMEDGQNYWIEVSAERLAKNIMLDFPTADGQFSDNYFDLLPGETRRITFKPGKSVFLTNEDLKKVTVMDTY